MWNFGQYIPIFQLLDRLVCHKTFRYELVEETREKLQAAGVEAKRVPPWFFLRHMWETWKLRKRNTQGCCWSQKGATLQIITSDTSWSDSNAGLLLQATAKAAGYGHLGEGPKMAGVSFKLMNPPWELLKLASPVATHFQSCWTFEVHSQAWKKKVKKTEASAGSSQSGRTQSHQHRYSASKHDNEVTFIEVSGTVAVVNHLLLFHVSMFAQVCWNENIYHSEHVNPSYALQSYTRNIQKEKVIMPYEGTVLVSFPLNDTPSN